MIWIPRAAFSDCSESLLPSLRKTVLGASECQGQNHIVLPESFPKGKIKHMRWYIWGHTRSYENHPAQRNRDTAWLQIPPLYVSPSSLHPQPATLLSQPHLGLRLLLTPTPTIVHAPVTTSPRVLGVLPSSPCSPLFPFISLSLKLPPCSFSVTTCSSLSASIKKLTDPFEAGLTYRQRAKDQDGGHWVKDLRQSLWYLRGTGTCTPNLSFRYNI